MTHADERAWRHLDSCVFLTFQHASPPWVKCAEHGVRQARLPWAEPHSWFTTLFERLAIDVLAACDVAAAARLLPVSWDEACQPMDRALVGRLPAKPLVVPAHVGVDEKAADTVRKQENQSLAADGDKSLAGSNYLWLYSTENLPARHGERFAALRTGDLKTAEALAIKESVRHFCSYRRRGCAAKHFRHWYLWATHSLPKPIILAAKTLKRREAGLFSYFVNLITNASAKGLNSRIQAIRVFARRCRNPEHVKAAIYFRFDGRRLYSATP